MISRHYGHLDDEAMAAAIRAKGPTHTQPVRAKTKTPKAASGTKATAK